MSHWPHVALGEVLTSTIRREPVDAATEYRLLGVRLEGAGPFLRETRFGAELSASTLSRVKAGDLIYSRLFAWRGAFGVVPPELDGCWVSNEFPTFRPIGDRVDPSFVNLWFRLPQVLDQVAADCTGSTPLTRNRYKEQRFLGLEMPLPPIEEQRRVVRRFERLAMHVRQAESLTEYVDAAADALLPAASNSWIGLERWPRYTVEQCCAALIDYRGRTPPIANAGVPHITSANIRRGRVDWRLSRFVSDETYREYMTRGIPRCGDVLFTMEAPLGEAAVLRDDRKFSLAQRTMLLRVRRDLLRGDYFAWALMSPMVREAIRERATGTTVKGIAAKRLRFVRVPVPPLDAQRRIAAALEVLAACHDRLMIRTGERRTAIEALLSSSLATIFS